MDLKNLKVAKPVRYCPFRPGMPCITECALYCDDSKGCAIKKMAYKGDISMKDVDHVRLE